MRILLYDSTLYYPSSPLFVEALAAVAGERGYEWLVFDEAHWARPSSFPQRVARRLVPRLDSNIRHLNAAFLAMTKRLAPDIILVVKGAYLWPETLSAVRQRTKAVLVNYFPDDPFNPRASNQWILDSIPLYDLFVSTVPAAKDDLHRRGARSVLVLPFGYKPSVHYVERPQAPEEQQTFLSDVVFAGDRDEERAAYVGELVRAVPGVRLHLYGNGWDCSREFRRYHRGIALGRNYRLALGGATIALNILRRANRSCFNMRTFEIPACGAFQLATRSTEHRALFTEDQEAAFFESAEEMVEKIRYYLLHDCQRQAIAEAGNRRLLADGHRYEDRLTAIFRYLAS